MEATSNKEPWHQSVPFTVVALVIVGPFALPLVWINKRFRPVTKIALTIAVLLLAAALYRATTAMVDLTENHVQEIQAVREGFRPENHS